MTRTIVEVSGNPLVDKMHGSPDLDVVLFLGDGVELRMTAQQAVNLGTELVAQAFAGSARPSVTDVRGTSVLAAAALLVVEATERGWSAAALADSVAELTE